MSKLSFNEIRKKLEFCGIGSDYEAATAETPYVGVAHKHNWDHGYETYYGYNGSRREFYKDFFSVCDFLTEYLLRCGATSLIVFPFYRDRPFVHNYRYLSECQDIIDELRNFLKSNGISLETKSGAVISIYDTEIILSVIEGAFRGASQLCLFSEERKVVIEPDHHFRLCIRTPDPERERELIEKILPDFPELSLF